MEQTFLTSLLEAGKAFIQSIDLIFMIIFMLITWMFNATARSPKTKALNFVQKVHPALFPLLIGIVAAIGYAYLNDIRDKAGITALLYAIILGMVIWKLGINKFEKWIESKLWK